MWKDQQVHARAVILGRDRKKKLRWLDSCTVDFIEARWEDIISDGWLGGALDNQYDVRAGILTEMDEEMGDGKEKDKTV